MKPHIEIRTDKPQELLGALEAAQKAGSGRGAIAALKPFERAHFRLVETEHQGFANYETFTIGIWIDCDRKLSDTTLALARKAILMPDPSRVIDQGIEFAAELDLADALKDQWDLNSPEIPEPWNSLSNAALGNVDWLDLARHYIAKVKEGVSV